MSVSDSGVIVDRPKLGAYFWTLKGEPLTKCHMTSTAEGLKAIAQALIEGSSLTCSNEECNENIEGIRLKIDSTLGKLASYVPGFGSSAPEAVTYKTGLQKAIADAIRLELESKKNIKEDPITRERLEEIAAEIMSTHVPKDVPAFMTVGRAFVRKLSGNGGYILAAASTVLVAGLALWKFAWSGRAQSVTSGRVVQIDRGTPR